MTENAKMLHPNDRLYLTRTLDSKAPLQSMSKELYGNSSTKNELVNWSISKLVEAHYQGIIIS